jgi:hypothetical protein
MADITLADYTGYIFLEIIKAREMADQYARQVAETYAKDPVLQYFSVPRFKVPKMELTIPVLISGARFQQVIRFNMTNEKFTAYIAGRIKEVVSTVRLAQDNIFIRPHIPIFTPGGGPVIRGRRKGAKAATKGTPLEDMVQDFYKQLAGNPDPSQPGNIVQQMWTLIFEQALTETQLFEVYKKTNPNNELFKKSLGDVTLTVTTNTIIDSTKIQSLMINPETNIVKTGSSDTTVFTIKAEMLEEGFFIRTVKNGADGTELVVEFE